MTRQAHWQVEIAEGLEHVQSARTWTATGVTRLIKVVTLETIMNLPPTKDGKARGVGYVTQEQYLVGKTPLEIERDLGLRPFALRRGCRLFRLARRPAINEYTYELTADMPDGLAVNPADRLEAQYRYDTDESLTSVPWYPPGSEWIPQWRVSVEIPLIHVTDLFPLQAYRVVPS